MIRRIAIAAAGCVSAVYLGWAAAQPGEESLRFLTDERGTQAAVAAGGVSIPVGLPSEVFQKDQLIDLDGEGARDVVQEVLWDDGSSFHIWLRRADRFIAAGSLLDFTGTPVIRNVEADKALEILSPGPQGEAVFYELDGGFGSSKLRVFRYDRGQQAYQPAPIEYVAGLRADYLRVIEEIDTKILWNVDSVGSSYGSSQSPRAS